MQYDSGWTTPPAPIKESVTRKSFSWKYGAGASICKLNTLLIFIN